MNINFDRLIEKEWGNHVPFLNHPNYNEYTLIQDLYNLSNIAEAVIAASDTSNKFVSSDSNGFKKLLRICDKCIHYQNSLVPHSKTQKIAKQICDHLVKNIYNKTTVNRFDLSFENNSFLYSLKDLKLIFSDGNFFYISSAQQTLLSKNPYFQNNFQEPSKNQVMMTDLTRNEFKLIFSYIENPQKGLEQILEENYPYLYKLGKRFQVEQIVNLFDVFTFDNSLEEIVLNTLSREALSQSSFFARLFQEGFEDTGGRQFHFKTVCFNNFFLIHQCLKNGSVSIVPEAHLLCLRIEVERLDFSKLLDLLDERIYEIIKNNKMIFSSFVFFLSIYKEIKSGTDFCVNEIQISLPYLEKWFAEWLIFNCSQNICLEETFKQMTEARVEKIDFSWTKNMDFILNKIDLHQLATLTTLCFDRSDISEQGLEKLKGLIITQLSLRSCEKITQFSFLNKLPLQVLDLSDVKFKSHGLKFLPIQTLKILNLSNSSIYNETLKTLKNMQLEELDISNCDEISDRGLSYLSKMPLKRLILDYTTITNHGLTILASFPLEKLSLVRVKKITNEGLENLIISLISTLKSIDISRCTTSSHPCMSLKEKFPLIDFKTENGRGLSWY
jgi:hypothetical protein